jgi:hypothetical protein
MSMFPEQEPIRLEGMNLIRYNRRERLNWWAGAVLMLCLGFILGLILSSN